MRDSICVRRQPRQTFADRETGTVDAIGEDRSVERCRTGSGLEPRQGSAGLTDDGLIATPVGAIAKRRIALLGARSANPKRWRSAPKTQFTLTPGAIKPERYRVQYEFAGVASVEFLTVPIWDWNFIVIVIAMGAMRTAEKERRHAKSQEDRGQSGRDHR
jgi:hypothetical protein